MYTSIWILQVSTVQARCSNKFLFLKIYHDYILCPVCSEPIFKMPHCVICLESDNQLISSGCACRGSSKFSHVFCRVHEIEHRLQINPQCNFLQCDICKQNFGGKMKTQLSKILWSKIQHSAEKNTIWKNCALSYASVLVEEQRFEEAKQIYIQVLQLEQSNQFVTHLFLVCMNNLAVCLLNENKVDDGQSILSNLFELQKIQLGAFHPLTLSTFSNISVLLSNQGKHEDAEEICAHVLESRRQVLGYSHQDTLQSLEDLCNLLMTQNKNESAERNLLELANWHTKIFGKDHFHTMKTEMNVGICFFRQQKFKKAMNIFSNIVTTSKRKNENDSSFQMKKIKL